ncbi:glutamate synthase large subunit [Sneathiella aquimaris]|uniref:glutamate synthase large subunit n=1 Tax=Sneathiella aquimaris TaxID=2599305 RepID=UPI00146BEE68|nr:glutamate synthase large subunit [Sneathiella aquimaris]
MTHEQNITSGEEFVKSWTENAEHLSKNGLYLPAEEHDNCGVGLVAAIDGKPTRAVVEAGIDALKAVWHRGAVDADGKTGDGCGIHVQIPQDFFKEHIARTGHEPLDGKLAVGMVFLPRTDFEAQETCRTIVESEILKFGYHIYGWRQVPVDASIIGEKANATRPEIEQIMIANNRDLDDDVFERELYIIRRRIEKAVLNAHISGFYICTLSCRSIIYKGMFLAEQLSSFYPDLLDTRFVSNFAIYHQRYSTNTFPTWHLAQPFRVLAHNGEINTIRGNVNWMKSHEIRMAHSTFGDHSNDVKPIIQAGSSDSAALDAVFEVLVRAGRSAPMSKTLLIPESWSNNKAMPEKHKALYAYCNSVMEPWDGPAAICATDGRWVVAGLDRNGLRPLRFTLTTDNLLIVGSETGMVPVNEMKVIRKGRVGPGEMIGVDLKKGKFYFSPELKDKMAAAQPFDKWIENVVHLEETLKDVEETRKFDRKELRQRQMCAGWSLEDLELILQPMAEDGKEAIGSMGDDTPLAVLSNHYRGLHHYFRQRFSQVTNPPIDSLRERGVMTLKTRLGNLNNILDEDRSQAEIISLESPILTNGEFEAMQKYMGDSCHVIDSTFDPSAGADALSSAIHRIREEAENAVRGGCAHLILSDLNVDNGHAPIPSILAAGGVHTHLVNEGLRTFTSINIRTAECLDVQYFAVLVGVGATTINPYLLQDSIIDRHERGLLDGLDVKTCLANAKQAVDQGLLKTMSKMGISVLSSYRGGYNFEAVGLSRALVAEFFPGMPSRISGIGLPGIQHKVLEQHQKAYQEDVIALPVGGLYRYRAKGEVHSFDGELIHILQTAVEKDSYSLYKKYVEGMSRMAPVNLRDLLDFKSDRAPISIDEVESITEIRKRFVTGAMSLGALSKEAHETLAIAMNRIGGKSDSGEGGEDVSRFTPRPNGDNANSAIKQIASGRFGVTAEYLNNCEEIEIKVAQGAKPGEGGQLPGFKVSEMIAKLRNSTPGVTLISPPPHHDIYSIEDLAQLIYDLKQINPEARVCVKLVAEAGIGTVAAGVAKAKADVIMISGNSGGTGASPQTSVKYAGVPWEMGLPEVNQVLTLNKLRHSVLLRVDGGMKTGRDIVISALMGGEEYGLGTGALVALGCILVRQCHSNTCPVGICTQDEELIKKYEGTADKVVNLFSFLAEEVREILASLGYRSLEEIVGRSNMLTQVSRGSAHLDDLDLNPLLAEADAGNNPRVCTNTGPVPVPETLDARMIMDAASVFNKGGEKRQLAYSIRNTHRAIGTKLSSHIVRTFGMTGLEAGHITVRLRGSAGQSLGAFAVQGLKLEVLGDANDYCGKGLSGGTIIVRPMTSSPIVWNENTIVGNTVLYGATSGYLFAAGQAGERFAVRNSGAISVVEGCGTNGCEYMTGGKIVILGSVGGNFGAGMTGGMAYIYDPKKTLPQNINNESVVYQKVASSHWEGELKTLIEQHHEQTNSPLAEKLLAHWEMELDHFWQICPKEMINKIPYPLSDAEEQQTA